MAKNYDWTKKGLVVPKLPDSAAANAQHKLCCKKNPITGAVDYYWALDFPQVLPAFSPCYEGEYHNDYASRYGQIGSTVSISFYSEFYGDIACQCRVVIVGIDTNQIDAYAYARYANLDKCKIGEICATGDMSAGRPIETIITGQVGLIVKDGYWA